MSSTFKLDLEGDHQLLVELAAGFSELGEQIAIAVAERAPWKSRRYRRSIKATTYFGDAVVSGERVRTPRNPRLRSQINVIVYTTSPLGHLLEEGTAAHRIRFHSEVLAGVPKGEGSIRHPGSHRYPHFWPGLASVLPRAGSIIGHGATVKRARVNTRAL